MNRRNFLRGAGGLLVAAPFVVRAENIMKVSSPKIIMLNFELLPSPDFISQIARGLFYDQLTDSHKYCEQRIEAGAAISRQIFQRNAVGQLIQRRHLVKQSLNYTQQLVK